jgi:polyhydroxyalkanoate synthase
MFWITDKLVSMVSPSRLDKMGLAQVYWKFWKGLIRHPGELMARNIQLTSEQLKLMIYGAKKLAGLEADAIIVPEKGDRRFANPAWSEQLVFDVFKQSYLLASRYFIDLAGNADLDKKSQHKLDFFTRQALNTLSPGNFALSNPEVIQTTIDSKGANLVRGMQNLVGDLVAGKGKLNISMVDKSKFEIGKNIATSPGKVVFENEMMQLIQYSPTTDKVFKRPLVIFPPWINKFYILDLSPKNSFIRWAVGQGYTLFIVSWVNPDKRLAQKTFEDYLNEGIFTALDAIEAATGEKSVNAIGYCIGGTLLACALSQMAATGDKRIHSATYFTTQVDFSEAGDLMVFIDEDQLDSLEKKMKKDGYLDSSAMSATFNMLRSNDLIWSFVINNYLLGRPPAAFDLLYWNDDSTRMPIAMHSYYLREMYLKNNLVKPGKMVLNGMPVDLTKVTIPIFLQSGEEDHIAPCRSVYKATRHYSGPVTFMLAGSGHIAGVVNSPEMNKYHFYTNPEIADNVEEWLAGSERHAGSWWPYWHQWLYRKSGPKVPVRIPGDGGLEAIEDAPGRYVRMA